MIHAETKIAIANFIFQDILCRWGAVYEIITDNGKPFVATLEHLADKYRVRHIRISGYNSRANGLVEHKHWDL